MPEDNARESLPHTTSPEKQQHQEAKANKRPQNNRIAPPSRPNLPNQRIHPRHLTSRTHNAPVDTRQRLALQPKVLVNRIRLAQHPVHHIMALIDPTPLLEHVVCFRLARVGSAVGVDIGADVGKEVGSIACFANSSR